jgi:hypothetical protein
MGDGMNDPLTFAIWFGGFLVLGLYLRWEERKTPVRLSEDGDDAKSGMPPDGGSL